MTKKTMISGKNAVGTEHPDLLIPTDMYVVNGAQITDLKHVL